MYSKSSLSSELYGDDGSAPRYREHSESPFDVSAISAAFRSHDSDMEVHYGEGSESDNENDEIEDGYGIADW